MSDMFFFAVLTCWPSQECIFYASEDEYYCPDVCTPSTCGDEEVCSLEHVDCVRAPCPPVAVCTDSCGGACTETQVRNRQHCLDTRREASVPLWCSTIWYRTSSTRKHDVMYGRGAAVVPKIPKRVGVGRV